MRRERYYFGKKDRQTGREGAAQHQDTSKAKFCLLLVKAARRERRGGAAHKGSGEAWTPGLLLWILIMYVTPFHFVEQKAKGKKAKSKKDNPPRALFLFSCVLHFSCFFLSSSLLLGLFPVFLLFFFPLHNFASPSVFLFCSWGLLISY
jgi:hypothetical protein